MMRRQLVGSLLAAAAVGLVIAVARPTPVYSHKPTTTNILFKNEIAQIFQRKCFQCHSENNVAFPLTTYTEARPWARAIREEILERQMPPWQPIPGYGHFANDLSLTGREKEIILAWADGGAPSGVLKAEESIPPVYVATEPEWDHGEPDQVFPVGDGHLVPAGAPFAVTRFVVATNLPRATRVRMIALKQGDRRVVRSAAFYDERSGKWLGGWTPWHTASALPDGLAVSLPPRTRVVVDIGYAGVEQDVTDRSELGLYFDGDRGPSADAISVATPETSVAPGAAAERLRAETKLPADISALALWVDAGAGTRSLEVTAVEPDGMMTPLLWIQDYRPEWPSPYVLSRPLPLPRGTRLVLTAYLDNPGSEARAARVQTWLLTGPSSRQVSERRR